MNARYNQVATPPATARRIKGSQRPLRSSILMEPIPQTIMISKKKPERRLRR